MDNLDILKAAIKRRGYAVMDRTHAEFPNMIILWIACDDGSPVTTAPGVQRVIWASHLEQIVRDLAEHCDRMLASMSGGQRHMRCANCDAPLLMSRESEVRPLDFPERWLQLAQLEHIPTEQFAYRSARSGPKSGVLIRCPQCRTLLSEQTVQEIDDAVRMLGDVMAELEATYGASVRVQNVQMDMQHEPTTIAQWRTRMTAWGKQGADPDAQRAYQKIPGVVFAHPVELREAGREIWSRRTGQMLFSVLREEISRDDMG